MTPLEIGRRLRELRRKAKLTVTELAERSFVSKRSITRFEWGKCKPGRAASLHLAEALGVECSAFLENPADKKKAGKSKFRKGSAVHVTQGALANCFGFVLDQEKPVDDKGRPLPPTLTGSGFFWLLLTFNGVPFTAHLHEEDLV